MPQNVSLLEISSVEVYCPRLSSDWTLFLIATALTKHLRNTHVLSVSLAFLCFYFSLIFIYARYIICWFLMKRADYDCHAPSIKDNSVLPLVIVEKGGGASEMCCTRPSTPPMLATLVQGTCRRRCLSISLAGPEFRAWQLLAGCTAQLSYCSNVVYLDVSVYLCFVINGYMLLLICALCTI